MAVVAELFFDTDTGPSSERIRWNLDISDPNAPAQTTPVRLIGDGTAPVVLNYHKDQNIYKPTMGSSMQINVVIPNSDYILPDFNAGSQFQYEVRLRRSATTSVSSGTLINGATFQDINATDVAEAVTDTGSPTTPLNFINVMITNGADRDDLGIGAGSAGRNLYASRDNGQTVFFVGTLRDDNNRNGNPSRIRLDRSAAQPASPNGPLDINAINNNVQPGDEIWLANAGDDGTTTSFEATQQSTMVDYWCGFINPIQSTENVTDFPFGVSFTATDRLGLLGQQSLVYENVNHDPSLIGYVGRALRQTGLELPLYVDSGVRNSAGDALLDAQASPFVFFEEDASPEQLGSRATLREALNGVLETFNCRIFQSDAKWWVTNCSTHGNATDTNVEFAQFVPDTDMTGHDDDFLFPGDTGYIPTVNITEYRRATAADEGGATVTIPSLRYNITDSGNPDVSIINEDLTLSLREPFGSVEARPDNLTQDPQHPNFDFRDRTEGWDNTGSARTPLMFDENVYLTGERSVTTNTNTFEIDTADSVWFRSQTLDVDGTTPTEFSFDWRWNSSTDTLITGLTLASVFGTRPTIYETTSASSTWSENLRQADHRVVARENDTSPWQVVGTTAAAIGLAENRFAIQNPVLTIDETWEIGVRVNDNRGGRIPYRFRLTLPEPVTYQSTINDLVFYEASNSIVEVSKTQFYWDFNEERWDDDELGLGYELQSTEIGFAGVDTGRVGQHGGWLGVTPDDASQDAWYEETVTLAPFTFSNQFDEIDLSAATLEVEFFFPQIYRGNNGKRQHSGGDGNVTAWIDNARLTDMFDQDVLNPVYEYRQPNETITETYSPSFITTGFTTFRQFLRDAEGNPITPVWDANETDAEGRSLERLQTQQKLGDNKERLRYFEGTLINRTTTPLSQHHKININYSDYGENGTMILNGGTFNPKQNMYDFAGYYADSSVVSEDLGDVYSEENVDLIAARFAGTTGARYTLGVVVRGIAANAFGSFAQGDVVADSVIQVPVIDERMGANATYSRAIEIVQDAGFVTVGNPTWPEDSVTTPRPIYTIPRTNTDGSLVISRRTPSFNQPESSGSTAMRSVGGGFALTLDISHPRDHEFEELHIDVPVTAFVAEELAGLETYNVTIVNNITGTNNQGNNVIPVQGVGGNDVLVEFDFTPTNAVDNELLVGNVNTPTQAGTSGFSLANYRESQNGESVGIAIPYEIMAGGETGVTLTFSGATNAKGNATNPVFTFNGDFQFSSLSNVTIQPPSDSSYSHTGPQAGTFDGEVYIVADEGRFLTASGFSQLGTTPGVGNIAFHQISSDTVKMTYTVTFESANRFGRDIVITGNATAVRMEPYSLTFVANNLGVIGGSITFNTDGDLTSQESTHFIGYNQDNFVAPNNSIDSFELVVIPASGMRFTASTDVEIDINEASVVNTEDGTRFALPETQFEPSANTSVGGGTGVDNQGRLHFLIDGTIPNIGGNFVIDINVTGAANVGIATMATFALDTYVLAQGGGLPSVGYTANGSVEATFNNTAWVAGFSVTPSSDTTGNVGHNGAIPANNNPSVRSTQIFLHPLGDTSTTLDTLTLSQDGTVEVSEQNVNQNFVSTNFLGGSDGQPTIWQVIDSNGRTTTIDINGVTGGRIPEDETHCVASGQITRLSGTGTHSETGTACGLSLAAAAEDANTVGGLTLNVQTTAPLMGTPTTTITFVTT